MLGSEQLKTGQQAQAIATFRRILAIDPKAPSARMLIARTSDEMKQPDSAFVALREAKAAGEDGQAVGGYALTIGNRLFRLGQEAFNKSQTSKTSEDYRAAIDANLKVLPWVQFADSTLTSVDNKNMAGFLMAMAGFYTSAAALTDAPKTKSCELSKIGQDNVMIAQMNTRETIDADGFLHTGDLARVDASGCIYIVVRLKKLIKYKGYQVPPAELEAVLLTHPGIADAAVVGVRDPESGEEVPKAFVVLQPESTLSGDEIMDFVAGQVRAVQEGPAGRIHRCHPEIRGGQDSASGAARNPRNLGADRQVGDHQQCIVTAHVPPPITSLRSGAPCTLRTLIIAREDDLVDDFRR